MNFLILSTLPNIDPQMISTICNIAFIVIIVLVLLGGLIGLLRGVWNASFRLIFIGILVILSYVFAGQLGNAIADVDLTNFIGSQTAEVNGLTINITSVKETLVEALAALDTSSGGSLEKTLSDPRTIAIVTELALIIIRFIAFICLALVTIIIGNLLATLLYHLIFKHIISKKLRKEVKMRLIGFIEGIVKSGLVLSMIVVPFSSVLNSISKSFHNAQTVEKENLDSETYNQLMSWIDAYDNSILAKALFNWTKDSDGNTLDMKLANIITSTSDSTMYFTDELSSLLSLGTILFASGAIDIVDSSTIAVNGSILLDSELISVLVAQLTTSNLVMNVLPIAADFALNMEGVNNYIDSEKINLDEIDWKNDLNTLVGIYSDLYESGIVDEEVLNNPTSMIKNILNSEDESVHTLLIKTFENFDSIKFMDQVLPALVWTMANVQDEEGNYLYPLHDYLPTDWEIYENIKFGNEFATIYDSIYRINKTTENALVTYIDKTLVVNNDVASKKSLKNEETTEEQQPEDSNLNALLDAILAHSKDLVPILIGERENDNFVNIDNESGKLLEGRCLLDSDLLFNSFNKLSTSAVNLIVSSITSQLQMELDSTKIDDAVSSLETRLDYKKEFGTMLDIVAEIATNDNTKDMLLTGSFDFNEEVCNSLKEPLRKIDNSKILKATIPQVLKGVIDSNSEQLTEIGLDKDSLDYDVENLGDELYNILDMAPSLFNIVDAMSGEGNLEEQLNKIESSDLTTVLGHIRDSKIFNPNVENKKENFLCVIDSLFSKIGYEDGNITDSSELETADWNAEIDKFGTFFDTFKECNFTKLLSQDDSPDYLDPEVIAPDSIVSLFDSIGESQLLSVGLGPILDKHLSDLLDSIDSTEVSFRNIKDWKAEGETFSTLLDSAQKLNEKGVALDNIDFINSDTELTRSLVKALSTTQLFTDENSFGEFLKNQLISTKGLNLADIDNPESYSKTTEFIAEISEKKNWEYEIDILFDFIKEIQLIGAGDGPISNTSGSDGLDKVLNDPSKAEYRRLFTAKEENFVGINNSNILRMAIANAIKDAASVVGDFNGIDLKINSRINVQALVDLDNADERNAEINTVYSALEKIQSIKGSDFNDVRNDNEQLTNLKDALIFLHDSKIFNTLQNENLENEADATVFEGIVTEFLNATLGEEAVIGTTDKINNTELKYKTTLEIVRDSILNNRCNENLNDEWITKEASKGEIDNLFELIQSSSGVDFDNAGNDTGWLEEKADDLLPLLNKSKLLFRAIPHYIHMFTEQCDTSDFTTLDGTTRYELNLRAATPEYTYNADTKEYDHYDDEEISYLTTIMNNFTSLTDALRNKLDINFIKGENEEIIKETLNALANSSVFNQFNAKDLMDANSLETNDTVFIQLMWLIFDESSLSKVIYDAKTDGGLYDYMPGVTAHKNARNKIIEFNKQNSKSWEKEIDDIFNIFDSVTDETVTQIQDINVEKMSPDSITNILKTINSSDLCYDAVPVYIKKAFENVALSEFSKYNGENKENYLIGREDYNIELNNINKLLNEICEVDVDGQVNYNIKFGSEFEISSFGEKGLGTFIQFLLDSEIFKDCRGLVLKNAINSVGFADYIRNDYDAEHKNVFDKIFEKIETTYPSSEDRQKQIDIEGGALNFIASSLKEVIGNIPQDGENVFTSLNAKAVDGIFKGCFQNGKALIASEIVAGFLSTNIKDSGYLDDYYLDSLNDYSKLWFYSNGEDFAYPLFNELEANALSSSIDSINVITAVKNNYLNLNNPYEENGMPTEMTNAQKIVSCLESLYSKSTNEDSMIAKFIYKKGIYDKLIGENGICTMVHSNKDVVFLVFPNGEERKSSFETAYNDMLTERSSIVNNKNLFKNVHDDIMNMFNALAN